MTKTSDPEPSDKLRSTPPTRRAFFLGAGALGLGAIAYPLFARGRGSVEQGPTTLRVGRTGKGSYDLIMQSAQIAPEGLRIQYSDFSSGHLQVEALNGGSLDVGTMSEIPPVFAAASSIQSFRQIATIASDVNNQVILLPRGSSIASLAELKGKKVGYVRATTSHYFLIRMLDSVGLSWSDIEPISLNVADGSAAFSQGALDAWAIYGFPIQRAIANDGARVLKTALGFLSGNYIATAHVDALADPKRSRAIAAYLGAWREAFAWQDHHWTEWTAILSKEIDVPLALVEQQVKARSAPTTLRPVTEASIRSQQEVADVFWKAGLIPKRVDVRPLWDNRFNSVIEGVS